MDLFSKPYNNLMIAYLLFPLSMQCMSEAAAMCKDKILYKMAKELLVQNQAEIAILKNYYQKIFSVPFDRILKKHKSRIVKTDIFLEKNKSRLKDVAFYLEKNIPSDNGLFEGKTGIMIWFCFFSKYSNEDKWDYLASNLWQDVERAVLNDQLSFNFRYGLSGIGWSIVYLFMSGFIDDSIDLIIGKIDNQLQMLDPLSIADDSLEFGIGGILAYFTTRLMFKTDIQWKNNYDKKLRNRAEKLLETSNSVTLCYYALLFLRLTSDNDKYVIKGYPQLEDWMEFSNYLPEEEKYWQLNIIDGCLNPTLGIMSKLMENNDKD